MLSAYRRHALVVALALVAGVLSVAARPTSGMGSLPSTAALISGSGWHIARLDKPVSYTGASYQVSIVDDARGRRAQVYLSAANVQKMLHWSGELGYAGAGYQASRRSTTHVSLGKGRMAPAPVSLVIEQRLSDRELVEYAIVSPEAIVAHSADDLWRAGWDALRGSGAPYYVVRVSVPSAEISSDADARAAATRLIGALLSGLSADARAAAA